MVLRGGGGCPGFEKKRILRPSAFLGLKGPTNSSFSSPNSAVASDAALDCRRSVGDAAGVWIEKRDIDFLGLEHQR